MDEPDLDFHVERIRRARVGTEHGPFVLEVEKGALIKFARAIGETNPLYLDEDYARTTRFGGIVAPPTFVSYFSTRLSEDMVDLETPGLRSLHSDDIVDNFRPIVAGDTISAMGRFADVYTVEGRNGRMLMQALDTHLTNQLGEDVATVRMMACSFT